MAHPTPSPSSAERRDHGFDGEKQGSAVGRIFDEFGAPQIVFGDSYFNLLLLFTLRRNAEFAPACCAS
jgi:hypothetical protein